MNPGGDKTIGHGYKWHTHDKESTQSPTEQVLKLVLNLRLLLHHFSRPRHPCHDQPQENTCGERGYPHAGVKLSCVDVDCQFWLVEKDPELPVSYEDTVESHPPAIII